MYPMQKIKFRTPLKESEGFSEKEGLFFRAKVGKETIAFVLQNFGKVYKLAHFASGNLIVGLEDIFRQEAGFRLWKVNNPKDWLVAAKILLKRLEEKHGTERLLCVMQSAIVLNNEKEGAQNENQTIQ